MWYLCLKTYNKPLQYIFRSQFIKEFYTQRKFLFPVNEILDNITFRLLHIKFYMLDLNFAYQKSKNLL